MTTLPFLIRWLAAPRMPALRRWAGQVLARACCCCPALAGACAGRRQPDLHRPLPQPDHRHLLELHPADQHRQRHHRQLRWPGGHPQPVQPGLQLRREPDHRPVDRVLGAGAPRRGRAQAVLPGLAGRHRPRPRHPGAGGGTVHAPRRRRRRRQLLPGALLREPGAVLAGGGDRLPVPGAGLLRPGLPDRGRSAVERRRADPDPQPRGRAVRQPGRGCRLRGRLRGRDRGLRHPRDVLVRRLPGRHLPARRPRALPHGRRAHGRPASRSA